MEKKTEKAYLRHTSPISSILCTFGPEKYFSFLVEIKFSTVHSVFFSTGRKKKKHLNLRERERESNEEKANVSLVSLLRKTKIESFWVQLLSPSLFDHLLLLPLGLSFYKTEREFVWFLIDTRNKSSSSSS